MTTEGLNAERVEPLEGCSVSSLTRADMSGAKTGVRPSLGHMAISMKTPPGGETTRDILEQIVRGERGRQLRANAVPRVLAVAPIHFNAWKAVKCKGRTRQSAGPPPAIAALRALQVRPEDLAAAGLEIGMWPM